MSGVKNLRAMFEQKGESSPPDRGRSPGPLQQRQPNTSESPRPLSKVRTNFVAIEKDGRIGLQRETSTDSVHSSGRKLSTGTEGETPPVFPLRSGNLFGDRLDRTKSSTMDPIPQSPAKEAAASQEAGSESKPVEAGNTTQLESKTSSAPEKAENPITGVAVSKLATKDKTDSQSTPAKDKKAGAEAGRAQNGSAAKKADKEAPKIGTSKAAPKTVQTSVGTKHASKPPAKSPTAAKTPTTPKFPAKPAEKKAAHPEKQSTPKPASTAAKATASKKPPAIEISPSSTGFVKPKPKSPTRPVRLPPGLTTHTAASAGRTGTAAPRQSLSRQSLSRQSGSYAASHSNRSPSRTSIASTLSTSGTKNLKRQSSTINRPRPSLGPPPKAHAQDHPVARREKEVDEGFLARMMRPTQASASKYADKAPHLQTPPRKTAAAPVKRPSTRDGHPPVKKDVAPKKDAAVTVKKPTAKPAIMGPPKETQNSTAKVIAPVAEKTATAEDAIKVAQEAEGHIAPTGHTTAEDVAPIVEQATTAEMAINVAKEAEGEISLPEDAVKENSAPEVQQPAGPAEVAETQTEKSNELATVAEANVEEDTSAESVPKAVAPEVGSQSDQDVDDKPLVSPTKEQNEELEESAPAQSEDQPAPAAVDKLVEEMEHLDINGQVSKAATAPETNGALPEEEPVAEDKSVAEKEDKPIAEKEDMPVAKEEEKQATADEEHSAEATAEV